MKRLSDETRAGILGCTVIAWTGLCLKTGGALGAVLWIAGFTVAVMHAVHDERMDRERRRRHRYEQDCARRAEEEMCHD